MKSNQTLRIGVAFLATIALVIVCSTFFVGLWGGKPEKAPVQRELVMRDGMTVGEFGRVNQIPEPVLRRVCGVKQPTDLDRPISEIGITKDQLKQQTHKMLVIHAEEGSKNWKKIVAKFALWFVFLGIAFVAVRKSRMFRRTRMALYAVSLTVFGIILGSDPSPMGTVKDAIVLFGIQQVIFPPRMIALTVFLISVFVANKFICSWGCQLGVLQDFLFRLNRNPKDTKGIIRQYKPSFFITNSIRIAFFGLLTLAAFFWSFDLVGAIDPFKIFHPSALTWIGWSFLGVVLLLSLVIYRPWCHLFCPFGLAGWIVEQISVFKIKVDHDTCTACSACAGACPSNAMEAILKGNKVAPDCFSCASCLDVCPTKSISFSIGKRQKPPAGKFDKEGSTG